MALTKQEFDRIDAALAAVLDDPPTFGNFLHDFAGRNAERLHRYKLDTHWSEKQWYQVKKIEGVLTGDVPPARADGRQVDLEDAIAASRERGR